VTLMFFQYNIMKNLGKWLYVGGWCLWIRENSELVCLEKDLNNSFISCEVILKKWDKMFWSSM